MKLRLGVSRQRILIYVKSSNGVRYRYSVVTTAMKVAQCNTVVVCSSTPTQHMVTVTLILKLPDWSAKSRATLASKTRQSLDATADATPSCTLRGVASHVRRRFTPFSSSLQTSVQRQCRVTSKTQQTQQVGHG